MPKILYEVGDIVLVDGNKSGLILPDNRVLVVYSAGSAHTIQVQSGLDNVEPLRDSEVKNLDYYDKIAFRSVIAALGIKVSEAMTQALI